MQCISDICSFSVIGSCIIQWLGLCLSLHPSLSPLHACRSSAFTHLPPAAALTTLYSSLHAKEPSWIKCHKEPGVGFSTVQKVFWECGATLGWSAGIETVSETCRRYFLSCLLTVFQLWCNTTLRFTWDFIHNGPFSGGREEQISCLEWM